jgi:hypothetical protein
MNLFAKDKKNASEEALSMKRNYFSSLSGSAGR